MLRRPLGALVCLCTLVPLTPGCDGYTPPLTGCAAPLVVTVTAGTEPSFSWAGDCALARVMVESAASGVGAWGAISPLGTNALNPPVAYGGTPPGAIATANMVPQLVSGTTYRVTLQRYDDAGALRSVGSATFVP